MNGQKKQTPASDEGGNIKLGFLTAIVPDLDLEQTLDFAAANGYTCIEVACWPVGKAERKFAGVTHIDVTDLSTARVQDIQGMCQEKGVSLSALGYYPNPLDPDPAVSKAAVDHLKKVIRAASMFGLGANSFVGCDWTRTIDENWPRFLKTWKPIIKFAEDQGVRIGIENCPMLFSRDEWPGGKNLATTPEVWRRMFSDIPSDCFGLNYDPSHFVLQRMDPLSPLKEFKSKLFHLHAKDMIVHPERLNEVGVFAFPKKWHTPRIPGFGDIDWGKYMARLYEIGYSGPLCVEVEDDTFGKTLEGRKKALKIASNVLNPYFA
jgi:sugar phosphate isomerase/epimerase